MLYSDCRFNGELGNFKRLHQFGKHDSLTIRLVNAALILVVIEIILDFSA